MVTLKQKKRLDDGLIIPLAVTFITKNFEERRFDGIVPLWQNDN